jgi:hypothetical protein
VPSFTGRFDYLSPGRGATRSGDCQISFDERTVTLATSGPPLAFDLGDIDAFESGDYQVGPPLAFDLGDIDAFESGDYQVRLSLFSGHDLVLTRFAKAFQDMERQLREAYRDRLVQCLLVSDLDEVARFAGCVELESPIHRCSGPAEIRLYESNLAVLPDSGTGFQWRLGDIDRVEFDDASYAVRLVSGAGQLTVGRLAKRTGELAERTRSRITALHERSARALHRVFPFLSPDQFPRLAALLRESTSASIADIAELHPLVQLTLLETVVDAGLKAYIGALASRATSPWFAGFKIIRQESTAGEGLAGGEDEEGGGGRRAQADARATVEGPAPRAGSVLDAGDGLELLFWFFFPIGGTEGRPTHLAWEATSRGGRATYVFRLAAGRPVADSVARMNRGLVALNFRREPVYLDASRLESEHRYRHYAIALRKVRDLGIVRESFVGRAIHTSLPAWAQQLDELLAR